MRILFFLGHFQVSRWAERNQVYPVYGMAFLPCLIILPEDSRGLIMGTFQPFCSCLGDKTPAILWREKALVRWKWFGCTLDCSADTPCCRSSHCRHQMSFICTDTHIYTLQMENQSAGRINNSFVVLQTVQKLNAGLCVIATGPFFMLTTHTYREHAVFFCHLIEAHLSLLSL